MQRPSRAAVATCGWALAACFWLGPAPQVAASAPADPASPPVFGPLLAARPLDSLRVTGGFGEVRSNHFHAGFDFSTDGLVGRLVHAPEPGSIERVRASGAGYGRSLYLRAADGRLLVFGHLDAFAPALAAYVDSAQRAAGLYEQDLWPAPGRFRFAAGETLAWSGQSGAGGPHLHFEIRHGDFAIHPLRGGLASATYALPRLVSLTLEPLDARSRVAGGVWPRTFALRAGAGDTLEVEGRVRAVLRSASGVPGAAESPAWSTAMQWRETSVEARLDSISWAGEMSELDEVVDRGRIAGSGGLVLWAPAGFRPRFLRTSADSAAEAGTIEVNRGDAPRVLRLTAREPGGATVERFVALRPPADSAVAPARRAPARAGKAGKPEPDRVPAWSFAILPGPLVRVRVTGAPAALDSVRIERARDAALGEAAQWDGSGWVAILSGEGLPDREGFWIKARRADGRAWWHRAAFELWPAGANVSVSPAPGLRLPIAFTDVFEYGLVLAQVLPGTNAPAQGLSAAGQRFGVWPEDLPLRRSPSVVLPVAPGDSAAGLGLYRRRARGAWEWLGAAFDKDTRSLSASTSSLGEFALLRDRVAPRLRVFAPPARSPDGAYSRWQLVAAVRENGSGLDASASAFRVDGVRVPTEWDPEAKQLRWRPLAPPSPGRHAYELRAADRAGNPASRRGFFVLDSPRHKN
jgi:hypothetical protein